MTVPSRELLQTIAAKTAAGVPWAIALAIAERESAFDPRKVGGSGEIGLMQLLPKTVREELGYRGPLAALHDPALNTALGTRYLKVLFDRWKTWPVAIRAYNGSGPAARAYAAGVLAGDARSSGLPTWDAFVRANQRLFDAARAGAGWIVVAVAALAGVLLLAQLGKRTE